MLKNFLKDKNCKLFIFALTIIIIIILYLVITTYALPHKHKFFNSSPKLEDSTCNIHNINEAEENVVEVINVYANWCGWSKRLLPEWDKVEKHFRGNNNISIRKIEENEDPELIQKLQIQGFPSIFKLQNSEISEFPHNEKRTAENIIRWISS